MWKVVWLNVKETGVRLLILRGKSLVEMKTGSRLHNQPSLGDTTECQVGTRGKAQEERNRIRKVRKVAWALKIELRAYLPKVDPSASGFMILWLFGHQI